MTAGYGEGVSCPKERLTSSVESQSPWNCMSRWTDAGSSWAETSKPFRFAVLSRDLRGYPTRYEYANAMRDLLGVDLDFARNLPPDPISPKGFLNDGATLEMSPTQIEMYLDIARRSLAEAIVIGERPKLHEFSQTTTAIGDLPKKKVAGHQPVKPEFILDLKEFPRHGEFELKTTASSRTRKREGP
ncbi:DUF1587 domain-containing protein [Stieleria sp. ICT_E10.1]|uniref:DUF1587 domain-containing protein n=1 Tax=Stieleria sedimenti TaxID=2976331 RepID=UPI00217F28A1|nr:DUF1587 domain-containing protein [Stieleria sedimenti]MCS7466943.1 DUF1587 domain-containing protein [Stieleria sedimenti]